MRQGGGHEGDAIMTALGIADQNAPGGEIDFGDAEIQQLVEAHAGMGQGEKPSAGRHRRQRLLCCLGKDRLHQTCEFVSRQAFGQRARKAGVGMRKMLGPPPGRGRRRT